MATLFVARVLLFAFPWLEPLRGLGGQSVRHGKALYAFLTTKKPRKQTQIFLQKPTRFQIRRPLHTVRSGLYVS